MSTDLHAFQRYRVFFTVLVSENTYGDTIDVTEDIDITDLIKDVSNITNEIDDGDYDIGIFTYGDITLKCVNHKRKFSPADDWRSIFPYKRDKTKVHIKYYDGLGNEEFVFRGIINDEGSKSEVFSNEVKFRVLSMDSILKQVEVSPGVIGSEQLFSSAIRAILNVPEITTLLNYSPSNVSINLDLEIDDGEFFSSLSAREALNNLLLASNSILYVDFTDTIYVKPRYETDVTYYFYGRGDPYGRENILDLGSFNSGVQRAFSSVKVNETVKTDQGFVELYGFRQKSVSFDFIFDPVKEEKIAENILNFFKVPKDEIEIEVPIFACRGIELLNKVSISLPYIKRPADGESVLPAYGISKYGEGKYAQTFGSYRIDPSVKWKVIGIREKTKNLSKVLKLRVAGESFGDGVF